MMPTVCLPYPRHYLRHALRTYLDSLPSRKLPQIHLQQRVPVSLARPALRPAPTFLTASSWRKKAEERGVSTVCYMLTIKPSDDDIHMVFVQNGAPPTRVYQRCLHLGALKPFRRHLRSSALCSHQVLVTYGAILHQF